MHVLHFTSTARLRGKKPHRYRPGTVALREVKGVGIVTLARPIKDIGLHKS